VIDETANAVVGVRVSKIRERFVGFNSDAGSRM
jgi:hypothetical protein